MSGLPSSRGFSMIEVLVTIVLISIGVLGMVAMQAKTISFTQDSVQRNTAAMLADDLLEMMRADSGSASSYYKAAEAPFSFPSAGDTCTPLPAASSKRLGCWAARAKAALPDAESLMDDDFIIERTGDAIHIQLAWRVKDGDCPNADASEGDDPTICRYSLTAEL